MRIVRAGERFRSVQSGIESWHCFSAGAHYDPDNVSFASIVGVDEHVVEPGAGFDWHGHRGVHIVTWVVAGVLHHEDDRGMTRDVQPGALLHQASETGLRHKQTNAGTMPLRFVQTTSLAPCRFDLLTGPAVVDGPSVHLFVARGRCELADGTLLSRGDSLRDSGAVEVVHADETLATVEA